MEDHKCVQFPLITSQQPLGVLEDMQAADGLVDNSLLKDHAHPPVIFGAGGPMYVPSSLKTELYLILRTQAEAVRRICCI